MVSDTFRLSEISGSIPMTINSLVPRQKLNRTSVITGNENVFSVIVDIINLFIINFSGVNAIKNNYLCQQVCNKILKLILQIQRSTKYYIDNILQKLYIIHSLFKIYCGVLNESKITLYYFWSICDDLWVC